MEDYWKAWRAFTVFCDTHPDTPYRHVNQRNDEIAARLRQIADSILDAIPDYILDEYASEEGKK